MALSVFLQEESGFANLNRLIDVYEVCLKLVSAFSIQSFYGLGLAKGFPQADVKIRESISRASMGHWMSFLREACWYWEQFRRAPLDVTHGFSLHDFAHDRLYKPLRNFSEAGLR